MKKLIGVIVVDVDGSCYFAASEFGVWSCENIVETLKGYSWWKNTLYKIFVYAK